MNIILPATFQVSAGRVTAAGMSAYAGSLAVSLTLVLFAGYAMSAPVSIVGREGVNVRNVLPTALP